MDYYLLTVSSLNNSLKARTAKESPSIWIPREISRIGFRAFHNCSKLSGMTLAHTYATHPITLEKGSDEAWSEFANIIVSQKKQ